jgi:hypothetical protein
VYRSKLMCNYKPKTRSKGSLEYWWRRLLESGCLRYELKQSSLILWVINSLIQLMICEYALDYILRHNCIISCWKSIIVESRIWNQRILLTSQSSPMRRGSSYSLVSKNHSRLCMRTHLLTTVVFIRTNLTKLFSSSLGFLLIRTTIASRNSQNTVNLLTVIIE